MLGYEDVYEAFLDGIRKERYLMSHEETDEWDDDENDLDWEEDDDEEDEDDWDEDLDEEDDA